MLRHKAQPKLNRVVPQGKCNPNIYNSWLKINHLERQHVGRYDRLNEQSHNIIEHEQQPLSRLQRSKARIVASSSDIKHISRSKNNLKSLEIQPEPAPDAKNISPNYNDIKMKRFLRQQRLSKNKSTNTDHENKTLQPQMHRERHTVSVKNLDKSIGKMVEQGHLDENIIKDYITQLQQVLVTIKQKQSTDRNTIQKSTTVKKKVLNTERKETSSAYLKKFLFRPVINVRNTIQQEDNGNESKRDRGVSETSLKDTQQLRQQPPRQQIKSNLLSMVISKTKQQRKMLNLIEVRERFKQQKCKQLQMTKYKTIEQTTKKNVSMKGETQRVDREEQLSRMEANQQRAITDEDLMVHQPSKTIQTIINTKFMNRNRNPCINSNMIEEENLKVQMSNFLSPLQTQKRTTRPDLMKLNLDISEINKNEVESIDSVNNLFESQVRPAESKCGNQRILDRMECLESRFRLLPQSSRPKKKLIQIEKWKKNFPVGFFDIGA